MRYLIVDTSVCLATLALKLITVAVKVCYGKQAAVVVNINADTGNYDWRLK